MQNRNKKINKINFNKFIWVIGEKNKNEMRWRKYVFKFYSVKLKEKIYMRENKFL